MKDRSPSRALTTPSTQNAWMGIAAVALALLAWKAAGQAGFLTMAFGIALVVPAWSLRSPAAPAPKWARGLVAPGVFLVVAGIFQLLAR